MASADNETFEYRAQLPMPNDTGAAVVMQTINVDPAIPNTTRKLTINPTDKKTVMLHITSTSLRSLRTAVHAFYEQLDLILRTLKAFETTMAPGPIPSPMLGYSLAPTNIPPLTY